MISVNMMSRAETVKGQGVASAYEEQVKLLNKFCSDTFDVTINRFKKSNITHYHTVNPEFFFSLPFFKATGTTVGYVHFLPETLDNSIKLPKLFKYVFYKYLISFYNQMDFLVTVNPYFVDRLAALGIDKGKVQYIPNYVSGDRFYPLSKAQKTQIRKKYGIEENSFTVLSAGQLQTRKGVLDFIKLAKEMPEVTFVWAGGFSFGGITDGYDEIKNAVASAPDNTKFLGIVDRSEMNYIYNACDAMILMSYSELFPMTILESMCCEVPIILRDLDIYPDILFDFYLKGNDNQEFKAVITQLKNNASFYMDAVEKSKKGKAFYSEARVAKIWEDFYKRVAAAKVPIFAHNKEV